jgi:hypothetical protein
MSFLKNGGQEGKMDPGGWYQWEREGYKERYIGG